jgi:D-alanine-D-alanine ligase
MAKSVAVIYGSDSSEWEVSVKSGEFTASQIDGDRYDVYEVFARFGVWTLVAYRTNDGERVVIAENESLASLETFEHPFRILGAEEEVSYDEHPVGILDLGVPS